MNVAKIIHNLPYSQENPIELVTIYNLIRI
jgi:hypothetical protein